MKGKSKRHRWNESRILSSKKGLFIHKLTIHKLLAFHPIQIWLEWWCGFNRPQFIWLTAKEYVGELIYTCKLFQPGIFSRFSKPAHFSRFKPDNLLLGTARFSGYNLEKYTGWLNLGNNARLDHFTGIYQFHIYAYKYAT